MKSLRLVAFFLFIHLVSAQDVRVPENLLEATTSQNNNTIDDNDVDIVEEKNQPPDYLIDSRIPIQPPPPCAVAPPFYAQQQQSPCEVIQPSLPIYFPPKIVQPPPYYPPEEIQTIKPIIDTIYDPALKEEVRLCPIGSVQNGNKCIQVYPNQCPHGYTWKNDRCVLSRTSCPLNFEWDGRSCVQRRICPVNHIWKNDRCILPIPECPSGWNWNGEVCQVDIIQCPPGSVVLGNECVNESFTCPPGFIEKNEECIKPPPICQPGYEYNSNDGFCVRKSSRCPPGSEKVNEECRTIVVRCPEGTIMNGNQCYNLTTARPPRQPITVRPTFRPVTQNPQPLTCPEGFRLYNNLCYRCPQSYNLCNNHCVRQECNQFPASKESVININLYSRDHGSSRPSGEVRHIINTFEPANNTIVNINNITNPITINNVNENNFYIHTDVQCADGSIKTVVVKNNETISGCVDVNTEKPSRNTETVNEDNEEDKEKCCEIVTPRQCRSGNNNHWKCSHRRYKHCGKFCIADRLYLKPQSTTYNNNVLTVAPSQPGNYEPPCYGRNCPAYDCSGCINGSSNCSRQCSTYPCNHSECTYLDQDDFCDTVGGQICEGRRRRST